LPKDKSFRKALTGRGEKSELLPNKKIAFLPGHAAFSEPLFSRLWILLKEKNEAK